MHYVMLILETECALAQRADESNDEFWGPWRAYHRALLDAGVYLGGNALQPASLGTTIRVRGGERQVQDGPIVDTKEQLGGYIVLDVPSLDVAIEWASRCPAAGYGSIELRPVADNTSIFSRA
ncbi:MAG: hypothetical protein RL701_5486 [Pseudomonadota bacterium]|jgi:hypothetical protein